MVKDTETHKKNQNTDRGKLRFTCEQVQNAGLNEPTRE